MTNEIGRELKVSELVPDTIVIVAKEGYRMAATYWVMEVTASFVFFGAGVTRMVFGAQRYGENLTDDTGARIHVYEYLGEP